MSGKLESDTLVLLSFVAGWFGVLYTLGRTFNRRVPSLSLFLATTDAANMRAAGGVPLSFVTSLEQARSHRLYSTLIVSIGSFLLIILSVGVTMIFYSRFARTGERVTPAEASMWMIGGFVLRCILVLALYRMAWLHVRLSNELGQFLAGDVEMPLGFLARDARRRVANLLLEHRRQSMVLAFCTGICASGTLVSCFLCI